MEYHTPSDWLGPVRGLPTHSGVLQCLYSCVLDINCNGHILVGFVSYFSGSSYFFCSFFASRSLDLPSKRTRFLFQLLHYITCSQSPLWFTLGWCWYEVWLGCGKHYGVSPVLWAGVWVCFESGMQPRNAGWALLWSRAHGRSDVHPLSTKSVS